MFTFTMNCVVGASSHLTFTVNLRGKASEIRERDRQTNRDRDRPNQFMLFFCPIWMGSVARGANFSDSVFRILELDNSKLA